MTEQLEQIQSAKQKLDVADMLFSEKVHSTLKFVFMNGLHTTLTSSEQSSTDVHLL